MKVKVTKLIKLKWIVLVAVLMLMATACFPAPVEPIEPIARVPASTGPSDTGAIAARASLAETEMVGRVEAIEGNTWTIDGRAVTVESQTPGDTAVVGDVVRIQTEVSTDGVVTARQVDVTFAISGNNSAANTNANPVSSNSNSNGNSNSNSNGNGNSNGNSNDNGSGSATVDFLGIVESIGTDAWTISGQTVAITTTTVISGIINVGDLVQVHAVSNPDGSLTALEIAPYAVMVEIRFTGIAETIGADTWTVSGQVVNITPDTAIEGLITEGDIVEVRAVLEADGSLTAVRIKLEDDSEHLNEVRFDGIVESIAADTWVISGQTVIIDSFTDIRDTIAVGDMVEVRAALGTDGSLTALKIELSDDDIIANSNDDDDEDDNSNDNINTNDDDEDDDHNGNVNGSGGINTNGSTNDNSNSNEPPPGNVNSNDDDDDHHDDDHHDDDHGGDDHHDEDDDD